MLRALCWLLFLLLPPLCHAWYPEAMLTRDALSVSLLERESTMLEALITEEFTPLVTGEVTLLWTLPTEATPQFFLAEEPLSLAPLPHEQALETLWDAQLTTTLPLEGRALFPLTLPVTAGMPLRLSHHFPLPLVREASWTSTRVPLPDALPSTTLTVDTQLLTPPEYYWQYPYDRVAQHPDGRYTLTQRSPDSAASLTFLWTEKKTPTLSSQSTTLQFLTPTAVTPTHLTLLIDASGSALGPRWLELQSLTKRILQAFPGLPVRVGVLRDELAWLEPAPTQNTFALQREVLSRLEGIKPWGSFTAELLRAVPPGPEGDAVILLTESEPLSLQSDAPLAIIPLQMREDWQTMNPEALVLSPSEVLGLHHWRRSAMGSVADDRPAYTTAEYTGPAQPHADFLDPLPEPLFTLQPGSTAHQRLYWQYPGSFSPGCTERCVTLSEGGETMVRPVMLTLAPDADPTHWAWDATAELWAAGAWNLTHEGTLALQWTEPRAEFFHTVGLLWGYSSASSERLYRDLPPSHPYQSEILGLSEAGILRGYAESDGTRTLLPEAPITRIEALITLLRTLGESPDLTLQPPVALSDVSPEYAPWVQLGAERGLLRGYEDGSYRPHAPLTRAEAAVLIARARAL
ncbi:S-layer homology domain-containing protein [Candidatus Peribacteria bacterium]|nr:S-layer homology domain-containing protein [Candidatus Peribacteria bacterium]